MLDHRKILGLVLAASCVSGLALAQDKAEPPPAPPAASAENNDVPAKAEPKKEEKPKDTEASPKEKGGDDGESDPSDRHPQTLKVGLNIQKLAKLELGPGTFEADFLLSVDCASQPCKPNITVSNGEIKGKPEKIVDEKDHKLYRVKAELYADIDLSAFPFDEHQLTIDVTDKDALDVTFEMDPEATPAPTDVSLPGWVVQSGDASIATEDLGDGLKESHYVYTMGIRRPGFAAVAKNLMPAFIMALVLFVSLLMKAKMAAPRLAAGTGTFVAVIMFHNTAANQLPPLGFLTLLDKFMFSLYAVWILHIAFSIALIRADEAKDEKMCETIYERAKIAVPAVAAVLWALVFSRIL